MDLCQCEYPAYVGKSILYFARSSMKLIDSQFTSLLEISQDCSSFSQRYNSVDPPLEFSYPGFILFVT